MGPLSKRILVSVLAIPLVLALVFWTLAWPFKAAVILTLVLGFWEYLLMCEKAGIAVLKLLSLFCLGVILGPMAISGSSEWEASILLILPLLVILIGYLFSNRPMEGRLSGITHALFGVYYFGILGSYLLLIRDLEMGPWFLLLLFAATWAYDTGGYFAGRWVGRHKLLPTVSPAKTWEGVGGGILLCVLALLGLKAVFPEHYGSFTNLEIALLGLLLSTTGQVGDLVESMVKRSLKVKDSGGLIPGHGGVFDRIDSLLFNAPVVFFCALAAESHSFF
jgi:phosphatidate cytidylyltransferase